MIKKFHLIVIYHPDDPQVGIIQQNRHDPNIAQAYVDDANAEQGKEHSTGLHYEYHEQEHEETDKTGLFKIRMPRMEPLN